MENERNEQTFAIPEAYMYQFSAAGDHAATSSDSAAAVGSATDSTPFPTPTPPPQPIPTRRSSANSAPLTQRRRIQPSPLYQVSTSRIEPKKRVILTELDEEELFETCLELAEEYHETTTGKWWEKVTVEFQRRVQKPYNNCRKRVEDLVKKRAIYKAGLGAGDIEGTTSKE